MVKVVFLIINIRNCDNSSLLINYSFIKMEKRRIFGAVVTKKVVRFLILLS